MVNYEKKQNHVTYVGRRFNLMKEEICCSGLLLPYMTYLQPKAVVYYLQTNIHNLTALSHLSIFFFIQATSKFNNFIGNEQTFLIHKISPTDKMRISLLQMK